MPKTKKGTPDPDHKRTLFVLFPRKVKDKKGVKDIYPGIERVKFTKAARRWCHIRFETEELARLAAKDLHRKKVKHGRLIVSDSTLKKNKEQESTKRPYYSLYISNIPEGATKEDLKSTFKTCKKICIKPKRNNRNKFNAIITMRSLAEAQEIFADKESHKINGMPITVELTKSVLNFIQNANKTPETVNVNGKELEGDKTVNTDSDNISGKLEPNSDVDIGCNSSLNKVEENIEKSSDVSMQEEQEEEEDIPVEQDGSEKDDDDDDGDDDDDDDDDDMEGLEDKKVTEVNSKE